MNTFQVEIKFGSYVVDNDPKANVQIKTAIDSETGKEYVQSVKIPMKLVETGKQVIKMTGEGLSNFSAKVFAHQNGLHYISHRVI